MFQMFLNVSRLFLALRNLGICLMDLRRESIFFPPPGIPQASPGANQTHRERTIITPTCTVSADHSTRPIHLIFKRTLENCQIIMQNGGKVVFIKTTE